MSNIIANKNNGSAKSKQMKDVQSKSDNRHIYINKVGITDVKYPLIIKSGENSKPQHTTANVNMFVYLPEDKKGTHMSRFLEILNTHTELDINNPSILLKETKERLNTERAYIEISFPYFIEKSAPVSNKKSLMDYDIELKLSIDKNNEIDTLLKIEIPVTSLCPCSKEISEYGAHSQRSSVKLSLRYKESLDIEKIIDTVENGASCALYPILKREDEKYVTEKAYDNPVFVEDLTRNIAVNMEKLDNITYFSCEVKNYESIHKHNAYAFIERDYRVEESI